MASTPRIGEGSLFELTEWFTVPEAAQHLSKLLGEEVKDTDVLKLVIDGHLELSVNILHGTFAKRCLGSIEDLNGNRLEEKVPYKLGELLNAVDEVITIIGIYRLPMIGAEEAIIKRKWQKLNNELEEEYVNLMETVVEGIDGQLYLLHDVCLDGSYVDGLDGEPVGRNIRYCIANGFPKDSVLAVRKSALMKLKGRMLNIGQTTEGAGSVTANNTNECDAQQGELVAYPTAYSGESPLVTIKKIAEFLDVHPSSIKNFMKLKSFPYHKPSGKILAYPSELDEWRRKSGMKKKKTD